MRVIPAIDLKGGRIVRLFKGRFDDVREYEGTPGEQAAKWFALGSDYIHVVDLDGARDGVRVNHEALTDIGKVARGRYQVGGGVRTDDEAAALLDAGAGRVVVGSAAAERPEEVAAWLRRFGPDRIVLALDVAIGADSVPRLVTRGWTEQTAVLLWDALEFYHGADAVHVLCTDISRDGAMAGPNVALYAECAQRFPAMAFQASGGVRDAADLSALAATGVAGAVVGRALLDGRLRREELKPFLPAA